MVHAAWSDWLWSAIVCGLFGYEVYMLGYSVSAIATHIQLHGPAFMLVTGPDSANNWLY